MKKTFALILILSLIASAIGCGKEADPVQTETVVQEPEIQYPAHLAICLGAAPATFAGQNADGYDASYIMHLFEGLYRYDAQGNCTNAIAQTEQADEKGLVWTFTLREDAYWSDGQNVRAQDFVYAWQRAVDPDTQSAYAQLFLPIKNADAIIEGSKKPSALGVEAISDHELQVTFTRKVFRVSSLFVHHAFYPLREDLIESYDASADDFDGTNLITNGAYTITQYTPDGMMLIKRDDYYAKDEVLQENIQFLFMEPENQYESFVQRKIYYATEISDELRLTTMDIDQSPIVTSPVFGVTSIMLHHDTAPLDDSNVRNALLLSIRQQTYSDIVLGAQLPATGLLSSGYSTPDASENFRQDNTPLLVTDSTYAQNLILAKNLLTEAGYEDVSSLNGLEFIYNADDPKNEVLAEQIAQDWKNALGFAPTLIPLDTESFSQRLKDGQYAMALTQHTSQIDDPEQILSAFITGVHENVGNYASAAFDDLMLQAKKAEDIDQRYDLYKQAEAQLLSDAAVIPLMFHTTQGLKSDALDGIVTTANGQLIFSYCTITPSED